MALINKWFSENFGKLLKSSYRKKERFRVVEKVREQESPAELRLLEKVQKQEKL